MTSKIGIILREGPRYGAMFRIKTKASEQTDMDTYGFTVIVHNSVSPISGAKVMAYYAISGDDENVVPRNVLSGSPFTTDDEGRFNITGDLPRDLTERTSFTVEYDSVRTVIQLCGSEAKQAPLPAGTHTSTRTQKISGVIGGDDSGVVHDEVGDSEAETQRASDNDNASPRHEDTASYSMRTFEKVAPPAKQTAETQNEGPKTPGVSEEEMRKRLCLLLGFEDTVNIKRLLEALERDIDERITRKEAIALTKNQMDLAMDALIRQILRRVDEIVNSPVREGLERLTRAQHDAQTELQGTAEALANRMAGRILRQVHRRQATSYLERAWQWFVPIGRTILIASAITALVTLYLGFVMR